MTRSSTGTESRPRATGPDAPVARRLPIGAEPLSRGGVHFRVWAPAAERVELILEGRLGSAEGTAERCLMTPEADGYHGVHVDTASGDALYRFSLDGGEPLPDPASRRQPFGVHGPSCVVDPASFPWSDETWRGRPLEGTVMQEIHIGTFTPEGTWAAAADRLPQLADVGIDVVEVMPVAEFAGEFGWGYDGVDLWAPTRLYGTPDDMRSFVDRAHAAGIAVLLDVVYNHVGPAGNYLARFAPAYFTDRYPNEWGEAINFDGPDAGSVREFFLANACHWIAEYHLDGLRLDATQQIFDASEERIIAAIAREVRSAAGRRSTIVVAENEAQEAAIARSASEGGLGLDALWNDDFHHTALVALTGHNEAYYSDYRGSPQELVSATKWGFLYQGQRYAWQNGPRGGPALDLPARAFVNFLENHDQVANTATGERLSTRVDAPSFRALTALLLLGPPTPLLFQGQEFGSTAPFLFFADHEPDLADAVRRGRADFLAQFPSIAAPEVRSRLPDPGSPETFHRSRLDWDEREHHEHIVAMHRDLIRLRRQHAAFSSQDANAMHGAVVGRDAFALRWLCDGEDDRLLLVNLGRDLRLASLPEPLIAPPTDAGWRTLWSSEDPRYGGSGHAEPYSATGIRVPGRAAVLLAPARPDTGARAGGARQRRGWTAA